jgi:exosortase E/protease (VPEID-CTERM system)
MLLVLSVAAGLLFGLRFDLPRLAALLWSWTAFDGLRMLAWVSLTAAGAALLFGGPPPVQSVLHLSSLLRWLRRPVPFLVVQASLGLALLAVTAQLDHGNASYAEHFLRYAVGWILLALAMVAHWSLVLLPAHLRPLAWRHGFEPLVAVALAGTVVALGLLIHPLWWYLNQSTAWAAQALLKLFTADVVYQADQGMVGTSRFSVEIACPCGGAYGIGLILIFLVVYLWLFRHALRFPAAFLLLPVGVSLMWLLNVARVAAMVGLGSSESPGLDPHGFHTQAGWGAFLGVGLGLVALARHSRFLSVAEPRPLLGQAACAAAYVMPLLVLVLFTLITPVFSSDFDWLYPVRVLVASAALWLGRKYYTDLHWSWSWSALLLGVGVFLLWVVMEPLAPETDAGVSLAKALAGLSPSGRAWWLAFRVVGAVLTVPLAEELAFRGYLARRLIQADFQDVRAGQFSWFACLASSLLFGVMHGRWLAGTLAGVAYAVALYRRGELADAVQAHATTNALLAIYVLGTGSWSFWV